jgi:hypothetical protein
MRNIDNRTLSFLSLLIIPGILTFPLFSGTGLVLIPAAMCMIGGFSFGCLAGRK